MSVEYFYENDLNMLYNAAVNNSPDGGEQHKKMLELYNNLVAYISHIEHWKSTALQLAKNYGVRIHILEQRIAELEAERRWVHEDKTMIVKKDGDSWCAVLPDFENLQQSESRWFSGDVNKYMDDVYGFLNPLPNHPRRTVNDVYTRIFRTTRKHFRH